MKNKQEQIEEMADIANGCWNTRSAAEALYNAGYRKIDENCTVITKDELEEYKRQAVKEVLESLKEASSRVYSDYIPDIIDEYLEDYKNE